MNNVADVQQHSHELSLSLYLSPQRPDCVAAAVCAAMLAQPALAGVNQWTKTGADREAALLLPL